MWIDIFSQIVLAVGLVTAVSSGVFFIWHAIQRKQERWRYFAQGLALWTIGGLVAAIIGGKGPHWLEYHVIAFECDASPSAISQAVQDAKFSLLPIGYLGLRRSHSGQRCSKDQFPPQLLRDGYPLETVDIEEGKDWLSKLMEKAEEMRKHAPVLLRWFAYPGLVVVSDTHGFLRTLATKGLSPNTMESASRVAASTRLRVLVSGPGSEGREGSSTLMLLGDPPDINTLDRPKLSFDVVSVGKVSENMDAKAHASYAGLMNAGSGSCAYSDEVRGLAPLYVIKVSEEGKVSGTLELYALMRRKDLNPPVPEKDNDYCNGWHSVSIGVEDTKNGRIIGNPSNTVYFRMNLPKLMVFIGKDASNYKGLTAPTWIGNTPNRNSIVLKEVVEKNGTQPFRLRPLIREGALPTEEQCVFEGIEAITGNQLAENCLSHAQTLILIEANPKEFEFLNEKFNLKGMVHDGGLGLLFGGFSSSQDGSFPSWLPITPTSNDNHPELIDRAVEVGFLTDSSRIMRIPINPNYPDEPPKGDPDTALDAQAAVIEKFWNASDIDPKLRIEEAKENCKSEKKVDWGSKSSSLPWDIRTPDIKLQVSDQHSFIRGRVLPICTSESDCPLTTCNPLHSFWPSAVIPRVNSWIKATWTNHKHPNRLLIVFYSELNQALTASIQEDVMKQHCKSQIEPEAPKTQGDLGGFLANGGQVILVPIRLSNDTANLDLINKYINTNNDVKQSDKMINDSQGVRKLTSILDMSSPDIKVDSIDKVSSELRRVVAEIVKENSKSRIWRDQDDRAFDPRTDCGSVLKVGKCDEFRTTKARPAVERFQRLKNSDPFAASLARVSAGKYNGVIGMSSAFGTGRITAYGYSPLARDTWERDLYFLPQAMQDGCYSGAKYDSSTSRGPLDGWGIQRLLDAAQLGAVGLSPSMPVVDDIQTNDSESSIEIRTWVDTSKWLNNIGSDDVWHQQHGCLVDKPDQKPCKTMADAAQISVFVKDIDFVKGQVTFIAQSFKDIRGGLARLELGGSPTYIPLRLRAPSPVSGGSLEVLERLANITGGGKLVFADYRRIAILDFGAWALIAVLAVAFSPACRPWSAFISWVKRRTITLHGFLNYKFRTTPNATLTEAVLSQWGQNAGSAGTGRLTGEPVGERQYVAGDRLSSARISSILAYTRPGRLAGLPQGRPIVKLKRKRETTREFVLIDNSISMRYPLPYRWPTKGALCVLVSEMLASHAWTAGRELRLAALRELHDIAHIPLGTGHSLLQKSILDYFKASNGKSKIDFRTLEVEAGELVYLISDFYGLDKQELTDIASAVQRNGGHLRMIVISSPDELDATGICFDTQNQSFVNRLEWSNEDLVTANRERIEALYGFANIRDIKITHISTDLIVLDVQRRMESDEILD